MNIIPAIDLQNGRCVRLTQGAFDSATVYDADPRTQAQTFARQGATWIHIVDLDGARAGAPRQFALIAEVARDTGLNTQVGGGIRDEGSVEHLFQAGISRVVVGSLAITDPVRVGRWLSEFGPERIVLAFDVRVDDMREPEVLTHGWQSGSRQSLWRTLDLYAEFGLKRVLCTDVGRDGMLRGPNFDLYTKMCAKWPDLLIMASGGVSNALDLEKLRTSGVDGVVVGKAIYEGRIDLSAVLRKTAHAC